MGAWSIKVNFVGVVNSQHVLGPERENDGVVLGIISLSNVFPCTERVVPAYRDGFGGWLTQIRLEMLDRSDCCICWPIN